MIAEVKKLSDITTAVPITQILSHTYGQTPMFQAFGSNPFHFLVAVMLSARSRDAMTIPVARRLFEVASLPRQILKVPVDILESIIRPIGFYRIKTRYLLGLCQRLVDNYNDAVPQSFDDLVTLPGVSRKVANVVLGELFHQDVIAVDIHVHRISNRLGWVHTARPEQTEKELMALLPQPQWRTINGQLVQHGQTICLPIRPRCSHCPIAQYCPKIGVMI